MLEDHDYINMQIQKIIIKNWVYNYHFDNLVKAKKLETKNIPIIEKNYKDLTIIYVTRNVHRKSIKMLCLHYYELIGKIEEHYGKNIWCLMTICQIIKY